MDFLKKGLAQVSAAVEKAREATAMVGSGGENNATSRSGGASSSAQAGRVPVGTAVYPTQAAVVRVLPDPTTLPETKFDNRDPREAHVSFLYAVFTGAPENTNARTDAFASFLHGFAEAYETWRPSRESRGYLPEYQREPIQMHQHQQSQSTLTGCSTGHPTSVLKELASAAPRARRALETQLAVGEGSAFLQGGGGGDSFTKGEGIFQLFNAVAIASRSEHNRAVLFRQGILDEVVLTLTLATRHTNVLAAGAGGTSAAASFSNKETVHEAVTRVQALQRIAHVLMETLLNYLEVVDDTAEQKSAEQASKQRNVKVQSVAQAVGASPAVRPLLESGGLGALGSVARVQRTLRLHFAGPFSASTNELRNKCSRSSLTLELNALKALCALLQFSQAAQNSLRGSGGLEVLVESMSGTTANNTICENTSTSTDSTRVRTMALQALRCATRRNGQNARDAVAAGGFGAALVALMKACSVEAAASVLRLQGENKPIVDATDDDATLVGKLRAVTLGRDSDSGGGATDKSLTDDLDDVVDRALRDSETMPPGSVVAELFRELFLVVAGDENIDNISSSVSANETEGYVTTVGAAETDRNLDRVVGEGLLPVIIAAALNSVDKASCFTRTTRAAGAVPRVSTSGDETSATVSVPQIEIETETETEKQTAETPIEPGSGGVGGFMVAVGNPFGDTYHAEDAFGKAFGGGSTGGNHVSSGNPFGGNTETNKTFPAAFGDRRELDPDEIREAADRLLRAHVWYFLGNLLHARPKATVHALRNADAWHAVLDDDGGFGDVDCESGSDVKDEGTGDAMSSTMSSTSSPYSVLFGVSHRAAGLWLKAARIAGEVCGHITDPSNASVTGRDESGNAPEVLALLETLTARATQPNAAALLAPALGRLCEIAPRPTFVVLLRLDGPARLGAAARAQVRQWGSHPAAGAAATNTTVLPDLGDSSKLAAQTAVLSLLCAVLETGGASLGESALLAPTLHDLLFELLWVPHTRALALRSLVAIVGGHCVSGGGANGSTGGVNSGTNSTRRDAWDGLVRRYLQLLPEAQALAAGTQTQYFAPLFDILRGLRTALNGPSGNALRTALALGATQNTQLAYVLVTSAMNGEYGIGSLNESVVLVSLRTLRSLLSRSELARDAFGVQVGYGTLSNALLTAWGTDREVSLSLVARVLELAVDADLGYDAEVFQNLDALSTFLTSEKIALRNPGALPVLITLLRRAPSVVSVWGLHALHGLLENSVQSRAAADQAEALSDLLDWFASEAKQSATQSAVSADSENAENPDEKNPTVCDLLSQCVALCASHSLSARHFRGAFRVLRDDAIETRFKRQLLTGLRLAAKRDGPAAYFDFGGSGAADVSGATFSSRNPFSTHSTRIHAESGPGCMVVTQPPNWPAGRAGYTFAAWIRVERFPEVGGEGLTAVTTSGASSESKSKSRVALFAMRGASGLGVAATLGPFGVEMTSFSPGSVETVALDVSNTERAGDASTSSRGGGKIHEKNWMFLCVAHSQARPPLTSAAVSLFIDGEKVVSKKLKFPKLAEPLTNVVIGAFDEFDAAAAAALGASFGCKTNSGGFNHSTGSINGSASKPTHPFVGQIGAVRFFDDALSSAAIAAIAALGSDYLGAFSPTETSSQVALLGAGMTVTEAREIREQIAPRLVLSLNAAAARGRECFSTVTSEDDGTVLKTLVAVGKRVEGSIVSGIAGGMAGGVAGGVVGGVAGAIAGIVGAASQDLKETPNAVAAELRGAARVCATHGAKDTVHCLGGVHVLFPLLAPRDAEWANRAGNGASNSTGTGASTSDTINGASTSHTTGASFTTPTEEKELVKDSVDLLSALLNGSRLNQEALHGSGGFALVGRLLKLDGGKRLSPSLLPCVENLVKSVGRYAWYGPGNDPEQAAVRLLLDLKLWNGPFVPPDAAAAHSSFLKRLAKRDPQALRALVPPPALMDAVCDSLAFEKDDKTSVLSAVELRQRRKALLEVCGLLLVGAVPALFRETAAAAANALEDAFSDFADPTHGGPIAVDVLDALVEMLQPEHNASRQMLSAIASECGGPAMVLAPMAKPHAETRALAIRLLAALLPRSAQTRVGFDADQGGGGGGGGGGGYNSFTPQAPAGSLGTLAAAPGAFVHSISSAVSSNFSQETKPVTVGAGSGVGVGAGAEHRGGAKSLHAPPGLFPAVASSLLRYPLTHGVRAALFELMLGGQPVPAGKVQLSLNNKKGGKSRFMRATSAVSGAVSGLGSAASRILGASHSRSGSLSDREGGNEYLSSPLRLDGGHGAASSGVPGIVHAAAAGVLLRLLEKCEDAEVALGALETLTRLVQGAPSNAHAILTQQGWQQWLIPTLRTDTTRVLAKDSVKDRGTSIEAEAPDFEKVKQDPHEQARLLTRRLLRALLAHAVLRVADGSRAVTTTVDVIAAAAARGRLCGVKTTRGVLGDVFDAIDEDGETTDVEVVDSARTENLWRLLPLVDETVARAAAVATGCVTTNSAETMTNTHKQDPEFDEEDWHMLDGTWRVLEELANFGETTRREDGTALVGEEHSAHSTDASPKRATARVAALQRTAFHLAIVYVHAAPIKACETAAVSLEALLPALLPKPLAGEFQSAQKSSSSSARLHLFLTSLVRAETVFGRTDPARASLAARLAQSAASVGASLLEHAAPGGSSGSLISLGAGTVGELRNLRERISTQKAAEAAAEDAREARRAGEARRAAAVAAADAAAFAFSAEQLHERGLCDRRNASLAALCERERNRRATTAAALDEEAQVLDRRWRGLHRELGGETGPWAAGSARSLADGESCDEPEQSSNSNTKPTKPTYKWKLDKAQDASGRRLRLKRNYAFVEYKDEARGKDTFGGNKCQHQLHDTADDVSKALGDLVKHKKLGDHDHGDDPGDEDEEDVETKTAEPVEKKTSADEVADLSPEDKRKVRLSVGATLVNDKRAVCGRLDISRLWVHFVADEPEHCGTEIDVNAGDVPRSKKRFWRWPTSRIDEVHRSRYRLQHVAVELFLGDGGSVFLAFADVKTAKDVSLKICESRPRGDIVLMDRRKKLEAARRVQERWKNRQLSTFEYLSSLNVLSGRTRNDLTQYPVFPWVLRDYTSSDIDLTNKNVYRDLSKPVGALEPKRLREFIERYELLDSDPDANGEPPFHYGSHYSSQGSVLHFLLRLEPFTGLARQLQGGRFDHADRLFSSVAKTWDGCLRSTADVKELTPEFYCLPEFLVNHDGHELGVAQDGVPVHDVVLPPWANGSAHEFIRVMREALESEIVSTTIHEWVDLVFGTAQVGKEAARRHNVFHHLTYEGSVDLNAITDPTRRAAAEAHVMNFGQTPAQLFRKPHPKRAPPPVPAPALRCAPGRFELVTVVEPRRHSGRQRGSVTTTNDNSVAFIAVDSVVGNSSVVGHIGSFRVATVTADGTVGAHRMLVDSQKREYSLECDAFGGTNLAGSKRTNASVSPFAADANASQCMFSTLANGKVLVSCGHWDHGIRAVCVEDGRELQIATGHRDLVTCLAVANGAGAAKRAWAKSAGADCDDKDTDDNASVLVVSGSRDTTCCVWEASPPSGGGGWGVKSSKLSFLNGGGLGHRPKRTLFGHDDAVTCVAASSELDLVVSGGANGAVTLHALRAGRHLRFVKTGRGSSVRKGTESSSSNQGQALHDSQGGVPSWVHLTEAKVSSARVLVYCGDALFLSSHGINARCDAPPIASVTLTERICALCVTWDERFLVMGGEKGVVAIRTTHDLFPWARLDGANCAITAIAVAKGDGVVIGGLADGRIAVWAPV